MAQNDALSHIAEAIQRLGNADAATPLGGLEGHGKAMLESAEIIGQRIEYLVEYLKYPVGAVGDHAKAISEAADAICGALNDGATAITYVGDRLDNVAKSNRAIAAAIEKVAEAYLRK